MSDAPLTTRAQQRAAVAARLVGTDDVAHVERRYNTLVHSLPVMVRSNGLLQTIAFLLAKRGAGVDHADHLAPQSSRRLHWTA